MRFCYFKHELSLNRTYREEELSTDEKPFTHFGDLIETIKQVETQKPKNESVLII